MNFYVCNVNTYLDSEDKPKVTSGYLIDENFLFNY